MRNYVFIGCGGFLGAVLRYGARNIGADLYWGAMPLSILAVNLLGAFLLAFILTRASKAMHFSQELHLGITVGFLGAFTTFSTLCKEAVTLVQLGEIATAMTYLFVSIVLGSVSAYFGILLAQKKEG